MKKFIKIIPLILVIVFTFPSVAAMSAAAEEYVCPVCNENCGGSGELREEATCISRAMYSFHCNTFNDFKYAPVGEVNPDRHMNLKFVESVEATCTEEGYDLYHCSDCGKDIKENVTSPFHPSGHKYEPVSTDCTAAYTDYICSVCGDEKRETKAKTSHVWGEWNTDIEATCTKTGKASRVCTLCDAGREEKVLPKAEHSWTDWAVIQAPTETKAGQKIRTCTVCKENQTDVIPAGTGSECVESVSLGDITMNYKSTAVIVPEIKAADGAVKKIEYSSSASDIASVDGSGNVAANKTGSAVITVTVTDKDGFMTKATGNVTVKYAWWQWVINILLLGFLWY